MGQSSVTHPKCAVCQFGKQEWMPRKGKTAKVNKDKEGILMVGKVKPGD